MKVYVLTQWGRKMARSVRLPDTPGSRVLYYLDKVGHATREQIESYSGVSPEETGGAIARLRRHRPPLVAEAVGSGTFSAYDEGGY